MRTAFASVYLTALAALSISLAGCGSQSPPDSTPVEQVGHYEGDGHDHGDEASGDHPTEGPHGGDLIELGNEEYHAELLHDEDSHRVTIHLLDGTGKEAVSVPLKEITLQLFRDGQFVQYALKAVPPPGSVASTASEFEIIDDVLCDALCRQDELQGRLQLTLNGNPYTGTIEHSGHDSQDHDAHAEDAHAEDGHAEDGHAEEGHAEEGHAEEGHDH